MGWTIRAATDEDVPALVRADWAAFGGQPTDAHIEAARAFLESDRAWLAEDGDRVVGSTASVTMELTVPGPATVPTAGVTYVGVLPSHRRQGILTALMARVADDARRRGEPTASLLASESTIYRRYGYGTAVMSSAVELERTYAQLRHPPDITGRVRILDNDELDEVLPPIHDRYCRLQPGEVSRPPGWWSRYLRDPEDRRGGAGPRFAAIWEGGDGYVTYRVQPSWENGVPDPGPGRPGVRADQRRPGPGRRPVRYRPGPDLDHRLLRPRVHPWPPWPSSPAPSDSRLRRLPTSSG